VVQEGKPAPEFELTSDAGETVKLSDLRGKPVVLSFSPKDDTLPTTTQQVEGARYSGGTCDSPTKSRVLACSSTARTSA
jgi:peroxiredoxin